MNPSELATDAKANGVALMLLVFYLGAVVWNGNLRAFIAQLNADVIAGGFWRWLLALVILYALASHPSTSHLFGPILAIAVAAMLIEQATAYPQQWANLVSSLNRVFGVSNGP